MKKIILLAAASVLSLNTSLVNADEEYSHFPSLDAPNTSVALCNLAAFNEKLQHIVEQSELTPEDMVKVHELTYTLENAVIRLQKDLETIAVDLEKVHKASERLDSKTVTGSGEEYLAATKSILNARSCQ